MRGAVSDDRPYRDLEMLEMLLSSSARLCVVNWLAVSLEPGSLASVFQRTAPVTHILGLIARALPVADFARLQRW